MEGACQVKFIINRTQLLNALSITGKAVAANAVIPACESYRFNITPEKLTISATNMKYFISTAIDIQGDFESCILISASLLNDLIKGLPEQPINFEFTDKAVTISYNRTGKTVIPIEDGKDFPEPKAGKQKQTLVIPSSVIQHGFNRTVWAIAADRPERPALESLLVSLLPGKIVFTGSDGNKLCRYTYDCEHSVTAELLIPSYSIGAFALPDGKDVSVIISDAILTMLFDETTIIATLLDDKFPDITGHLSMDQDMVCFCKKSELLPVLNRVKTFGNRSGLLVLSFSANTISVRGENSDLALSAEELVSCEFNGEDMAVGVNSATLIAALKNIDNDIYVSMSDPKRPLFLRDEPGISPDNVTLVTVMNIQ